MVEYKKFLPEPPEDCRDPELYRWLKEFEFVRWHPETKERRDELIAQLTSPTVVERVQASLDDAAADLRFYCAQFLLSLRRQDAVSDVEPLLLDEDEQVRGGVARMFGGLKAPGAAKSIARLASEDPSPHVRGCAAAGLGGQDPVLAIPILLKIMDDDHEEDALGHTPSSCAATALDEMMETQWTQRRLDGGFRAIQPAGADLVALREQALEFLRICREQENH